MTKKNVVIIVISAVSAILLCILIFFIIIPMAKFSNTQDEMLSISTPSGYYDKSLRVKIDVKSKLMPGAKIYYTIDGTDPDPKDRTIYENKKPKKIASTCKEYDGSSIRLQQIQNKTNVYVVKAKVKYLWMSSQVESKTYVVGDSIDESFGIKLISITSDFENLYDYKKGILVGGKTYDDNYEEGSTGFVKGNYSNRTEEWTKKCEITMFDTDNSVIMEQKAGLSVSGGTSAAYDVKSLKISADEIYDIDNPKLDFSLFNDYCSELSQFSLTNGVRLRSGSQDYTDGANIRSSVISELAKESGFDGYAGSERAIVFINSDFYGIFDIQYNYSNSFLKNRFSLPDTENIQKFKGDEERQFKTLKVSELLDADLNNEENCKKLEEVIDMDNYLLYCAINVLANNNDWPANNFEFWRYVGGYDGVNKYTDGRARFLIYDTDMTFMTSKNTNFFEGFDAEIFESLMEQVYRGDGSKFSDVMKSKYYRDKFVTIVSDLIKYPFNSENLKTIIEDEYNKIEKANNYFLDEKKNAQLKNNYDLMQQAASQREKNIRASIAKYFNLKDTYEMNIMVDCGVNASWNNIKLYGESSALSSKITTYNCKYYKCVGFTIKAEAYPSFKFTGFLVNGKLYDSDELTITDDMIKSGTLNIEVLSEKQMGQFLVFKEVHYDDDGSWIKVKNIGSTQIELSKFYISDSETNLKGYNLPEVTLKPGEIYVIEGSNLDKNNKCEYEFKRGSVFYLSNGEKIYDTITVIRMGNNEIYCRFNDSNSFVFLENTPSRKNAK